MKQNTVTVSIEEKSTFTKAADVLEETRYGWVIVGASLILQTIIFGIQYSYGVYLVYYFENDYQGRASRLLLALVGATGISLISTGGILTGRLADTFGYRNMAVLGSTIFALGHLLASFTTEFWQLFLTQGLMVGVGSSIAYLPAVSILAQWFNRRRGLATGICASGAGIGGMVFSIAIQHMIDRLGIQWALQITATVSFVLSIGSSLLLKERVPPNPSQKLIDLSLFLNPKFLVLWLGGFINSIGSLVPFYIMPLYSASFDIPPSERALLLALMNGGNALGRITLGRLADIFGQINMMAIGTLLMGLFCLMIWPFATTFPTMAAFCILYGLISGSYISLLSVTSAFLFGLNNIATTNGLLLVSFGIPCLFGSPLATLLMESPNLNPSAPPPTILPVILFAGLTSLIGACFIVGLKFIVSPRICDKV